MHRPATNAEYICQHPNTSSTIRDGLRVGSAHLHEDQRRVRELDEWQAEWAHEAQDCDGCLQRDVQEEHHRPASAGAFSSRD